MDVANFFNDLVAEYESRTPPSFTDLVAYFEAQTWASISSVPNGGYKASVYNNNYKKNVTVTRSYPWEDLLKYYEEL